MKASRIKEKYLKERRRDDVGVIAIRKDAVWFHVHDDEEAPEDWDIALHIRSRKK